MNMKRSFILFVLVALLGCGKHPEPRQIVILVDVSGSIERRSLEQAFRAIEKLAGRLRRGDGLTIIPILGDAEAEASGRIIRVEVPLQRRAYDADIHAFQAKLSTTLKSAESEALARPELRTDILGSVVLAEQEFGSDQRERRRLLFVLSDFIQEGQDIDFKTHVPLKMPFAARTDTPDLKSAVVFLGLLQSRDYARLPKTTRREIHKFWTSYFKGRGAEAKFVADGVGLLATSTD